MIRLRHVGILAAFVVSGVAALPPATDLFYQTAPYDQSPADRRLRAFDKSHPQCALWTDWHKLCSRTGPNGASYCRLDRQHTVVPSQPFCAISLDEQKRDTAAERLSRQRFSKMWRQKDCQNCSPVRIYQPDRPFGGAQLSQVEHPQCAVWRLEYPIKFNNIQVNECSEDGRPGMPSCRSAALQRLKQTAPFVCSEPVRPEVCGKPWSQPDRSNTDDIIPIGSSLRGSPVWGFHCNRKDQ
jgi:hypothetical protein